ncbi:MAG: TAXI family TRAP transporter solute-binding subunit [Burkholderiaceae bacterium]|nr:TAXI family TRAP transporter solute-binding subunit [Burkholderiaceae bacterium]
MRRRSFNAAMLAGAGVALLGVGGRLSAAEKTFITIGTGSTSGLYYPTGVGMAKILNDAGIDVRANARSTGASVYNCRAVGSGELQMGITQNNIAYYAYNGTGVEAFKDKPIKNLRGLTMLYPEVIQILARKDAGIKTVGDMKGKRVYVGDIGSGTEQDVLNIFGVYGLKLDDLKTAVRGSSGNAVDLLRDNKIDAMFYTVGIGASAITEAAQTVDIDLIQIPADQVAQLHKKYPFYTAITVPANTYPKIDHEVSTITTQAMMIVEQKLPDDVVYEFMNTIFGKHLQQFYNDVQNPNLKKYFKVETALDGMPIPVHPGAIRFFKEKGVQVASDLVPKG